MPAHQIIFRHFRKCGEDLDMDCQPRSCVDLYHQKAPQSQHRSSHNITGSEPYAFRESSFATDACKIEECAMGNQMNLFENLTG